MLISAKEYQAPRDPELCEIISGSSSSVVKGEVKLLKIIGKENKKCFIDLRNTAKKGTGKS